MTMSIIRVLGGLVVDVAEATSGSLRRLLGEWENRISLTEARDGMHLVETTIGIPPLTFEPSETKTFWIDPADEFRPTKIYLEDCAVFVIEDIKIGMDSIFPLIRHVSGSLSHGGIPISCGWANRSRQIGIRIQNTTKTRREMHGGMLIGQVYIR